MNRLALITWMVLLPLIGGCAMFQRPAREIEQAERMLQSDLPDDRWRAINRLVAHERGQREPYVSFYREIAEGERDPLVRATAIRALNRVRDAESTPTFVSGLRDEHRLVRLESAKALANLPDSNAVPHLIRILRDAEVDQDVRIAAADALRHYRRLEVARELVTALGDRRFGVAWQARQSLIAMTAQDYRYNEAAWLGHLTRPGGPFL